MVNFLSFSDSAKFADIARNLINGLGFGSNFSFWSSKIWTPPLTSYSIAAFFNMFGVTDFAVIATSFFYFILTLVFVFLLAKKVFKSNLVGILSSLAVGFNYDLIHYATSGASESPFIFEIVAASYFATIKKKWASVATVLLLILMYFTRPQAFVYIAGIVLYWLLNNFKVKNSIVFFAGVLVAGLLIDHFVLAPLSGKYFLYSITRKGVNVATQVVSGESSSDSLREAVVGGDGILTLAKKVFYNLYNFYKLLPQIISPYLFALFVIGLFKWGNNRIQNSFKVASIFMVLATFFVTAITIPFFRYIHPIIPLIYIVAVATIVEITRSQMTNYKQITIGKLQITKQTLVILASTFLILFFGVGQTLGVLLLDSRFERNTHNVGKPPVYVQLSYILRDNTNKDQIVITNLDTWGSWYGERKTVWFPLEPKQLIDPGTGKVPFDAIYLTSYLIDDENYYMGASWRLIFDNPTNSKKWTCDGCQEIAKEFKLKDVYSVTAATNYEKTDASAILLIKNK
jgi:4-amino-4-deoxy-L-arabinose transferase-like glycosyltransferase